MTEVFVIIAALFAIAGIVCAVLTLLRVAALESTALLCGIIAFGFLVVAGLSTNLDIWPEDRRDR